MILRGKDCRLGPSKRKHVTWRVVSQSWFVWTLNPLFILFSYAHLALCPQFSQEHFSQRKRATFRNLLLLWKLAQTELRMNYIFVWKSISINTKRNLNQIRNFLVCLIGEGREKKAFLRPGLFRSNHNYNYLWPCPSKRSTVDSATDTRSSNSRRVVSMAPVFESTPVKDLSDVSAFLKNPPETTPYKQRALAITDTPTSLPPLPLSPETSILDRSFIQRSLVPSERVDGLAIILKQR